MPLMGLVTALVSKSCTTLSASSFEDVSSVSGSHSLSEAMYLASLSLLRLICSEHNYTPFLLSKNTIDRRLEGVRGLRSLTNPAFAQIDNIHYISTMRGLSRVFFVFFLLFLLLSIKWRKLNLSERLEVERLPSFRFNYSTPRGALLSEGTQRGSNATPLRVPACGGVRFSNKLHHRPFEQLSRAGTHKP